MTTYSPNVVERSCWEKTHLFIVFSWVRVFASFSAGPCKRASGKGLMMILNDQVQFVLKRQNVLIDRQSCSSRSSGRNSSSSGYRHGVTVS